MALGLQTEGGGGDYTAVAKYDARAGRFFRVDRLQDSAGNWSADNVDISNGFQAVMDLENIHVGWMLFAAGVAPQFNLVPLGDPLPPRPTDQHKQGFRLMMKLGKSVGGDAREFASQAKVVIGAVDALHSEFEKGKAANPGKLPVVAMTGTTPVVSKGKGQSSTNYAPIFKIERWVDRPAELTPGGAAQVATTQAAAPASPPASAPQQAQAHQPEPAMAGGEEF
jgi:hypothetical protein